MLFLLRYVPKQYLPQACVASWLLWLLLGALFYSLNGEYHWTFGFYQAVNVGYSIGWGFPGEVNSLGIWFSIIYVMMGVVAISGIIGVFTDSIIESRKNWVTKALQRKKEDDENELNSTATSSSSFTFNSIRNWVLGSYESVFFIILWFLWVAVGVVWSIITIEWNFTEAVYFAISSLSTGGLWPIPADSSQEKYGFVAFFAAIGIPLMGKAMGDMATLFLTHSEQEQEQLQSIRHAPTSEEKAFIRTLRAKAKTGSGRGSGGGSGEEDEEEGFEVTSAEFVLICLQRTESVDPVLIDHIYNTHIDMIRNPVKPPLKKEEEDFITTTVTATTTATDTGTGGEGVELYSATSTSIC